MRRCVFEIERVSVYVQYLYAAHAFVCVCVCVVVDRWNLVVCMLGPLRGVISLAVFAWSMRFSNREIKKNKTSIFFSLALFSLGLH